MAEVEKGEAVFGPDAEPIPAWWPRVPNGWTTKGLDVPGACHRCGRPWTQPGKEKDENEEEPGGCPNCGRL